MNLRSRSSVSPADCFFWPNSTTYDVKSKVTSKINYMKQSLRAFMEGIIDYAGLFPPAALSLDTSIHKYSDYRKSDDSWMLSRFIIPADKLKDLHPYKNSLFAEGDPYELSVLGRKTETVSEYDQYLDELISQLNEFNREFNDRATTDVLEINIPREAIFTNDYSLLHDVFDRTAGALGDATHLPHYVFYEAVLEENWKKDIRHVLETLAKHNEKKKTGYYRNAGFKLRCGGTKATIFPDVEQVAFVLISARDQNVAVKCTAGLHHPLRHYADAVQTKMHGFFNVFGGAMLGYAHDLREDELIEIIRDEDPEHFQFTDEGFLWRDLMVFTGEIKELREVAVLSFGSCSFDEPREDLQQMGLL